MLRQFTSFVSCKNNIKTILMRLPCQDIALNAVGNFSSINLYFQDESRFGLFTRNGKSFTDIRVKPICTFQQVFKSTWLSGAFFPITGDHFQLILPHCNADNFT